MGFWEDRILNLPPWVWTRAAGSGLPSTDALILSLFFFGPPWYTCSDPDLRPWEGVGGSWPLPLPVGLESPSREGEMQMFPGTTGHRDQVFILCVVIHPGDTEARVWPAVGLQQVLLSPPRTAGHTTRCSVCTRGVWGSWWVSLNVITCNSLQIHLFTTCY